MGTIRSKLTYANLTASIALFIAIGGTSYAAATLPRNSVGTRQIRADAVGSSELRPRAVTSREIRNRSIRIADVSRSARAALEGPAGPPGAAAVTLRAAVSTGGAAVIGTARSVTHVSGTNEYRVDFGRSIADCTFNATLARVQDGPAVEEPEAGRITVAAEGTRVLVRTFNAAGAANEQPFHVAVLC